MDEEASVTRSLRPRLTRRAFASYRIDELATWATTNLKLGTINCPTVFNRDACTALPVQYRQLLEDLRLGAYTAMRKSYAEQDILNEERWRSGGRIEMVEIPESELSPRHRRPARG